MLPSTSPREAVLACPTFPPWNLPSFTLESTLSSPCSRSDPSLSRQGAALAHLDSTPWTDGSCMAKALCSGLIALFLLARAALVYLPTALSVALRPLFPFQQAQYAQVFRLKPAPFCTLFAGLGSTNKAATFLLHSDSCSVLSSVFPLTIFSLIFFKCFFISQLFMTVTDASSVEGNDVMPNFQLFNASLLGINLNITLNFYNPPKKLLYVFPKDKHRMYWPTDLGFKGIKLADYRELTASFVRLIQY